MDKVSFLHNIMEDHYKRQALSNFYIYKVYAITSIKILKYLFGQQVIMQI